MRTPHPKVKIPRNDVHELENAITREYSVIKRYPGSVSWDENKAVTQATDNMNELLDNYPLGFKRNEVPLEEAHHVALGGIIIQGFAKAA